MKRLLLFIFPLVLFTSSNLSAQCGNLYIGGVIDGPLAGGTPKGVQICASADVLDISIYGIGSANNGGGTDGEEFSFPAGSVSAGECFWIGSGTTGWNDFFGFEPCYTSGAMAINGDDAIELFCNGTVEDLFGDVDVDGNGECWEYQDGWAVNDSGASNGGSFDCADWTFSGPNALDGESDNATAADPYPTPAQVCPGVVPVEFGTVEARTQNDKVELYWETHSEINNEYFDVQWSRDGKDFQSIGDVAGAGNSARKNSYALTHDDPVSGQNIYRIKQVDFDGNYAYSVVVSARMDKETIDIALTPSPVRDELFLSVTEGISVEIFSLSGVRVKSTSNIVGGSLDLSDLQSGIYMVRIHSQNEIITKKIVKK